jgi:hypothetical protein
MLIHALEAKLGNIKKERVKNELESILSRLVLRDFSPEEAVYIVQTCFECGLEDLYYEEEE